VHYLAAIAPTVGAIHVVAPVVDPSVTENTLNQIRNLTFTEKIWFWYKQIKYNIVSATVNSTQTLFQLHKYCH
jgi:hypothetical protein